MTSKYETDMIVEIPYGSNIKYEFDKKTNMIRCDRILNVSMHYPGNYGYIQSTLAGDGDPLDVLLISEYSLYPGTVINVRIIGVLITEDENGMDEKILAVPSTCVDASYSDVNEIDDLSKHQKSKIQHFFEKYKDNSNGKWIKVKDFKDRDEALKIFNESKLNYSKL